jgi:hypothetical protein
MPHRSLFHSIACTAAALLSPLWSAAQEPRLEATAQARAIALSLADHELGLGSMTSFGSGRALGSSQTLWLCRNGHIKISQRSLLSANGVTDSTSFEQDSTRSGEWKVAARGGRFVLEMRTYDGIPRLRDNRPPSEQFVIQLDAEGNVVGLDGRPVARGRNVSTTCAAVDAELRPAAAATQELINQRVFISDQEVQTELTLCDGGRYAFHGALRGQTFAEQGERWSVGTAAAANLIHSQQGNAQRYPAGLYLILRASAQSRTGARILAIGMGPGGIQHVGGAPPVIRPAGPACAGSLRGL